MPIVTTDPTQRKIHTSSRNGIDVIEGVLERLSGRGARVGKTHAGLRKACSTDLFVEDDRGLVTLEVKYSESSKVCRRCGKVESDHLLVGCEYAGSLRPSHKNCVNRFKDAVGSMTNQWTSRYVGELGRPFAPCFLYFDLCDVGGPNVHEDRMEQVRNAAGLVRLYTRVPTPADLDDIADWVWNAVFEDSIRQAVIFDRRPSMSYVEGSPRG